MEEREDKSLVRLDQAQKALAEAARVAAIEPVKGFKMLKTIRDKAEAVAVYLRRIKASYENQNKAAELGLRTRREMGKVLEKLDLDKGGGDTRKHRLRDATGVQLRDLGVEKTESHRCQLIAQYPEKAFEKYIKLSWEKETELTAAGVCTLVKAWLREQDIDELDDNLTTPEGTYSVIVLDPPWPYGTKYNPKGRRVANPYPEIPLEDITALEIPAADDCVLWLWTTHKFMRHTFLILDAWEFRDVAILTWVKNKIGIGSWLRSQTEFCIMAVKGKPKVKLTNETTVIHAAAKEHSRKPDAFYAMVEGLCIGKRAEGFSREKRKGWTQIFSNEPEKFS